MLQGLLFIHKSAVGFHGDLNISNCLADRRFTIKISRSGYSQILDALHKTDLTGKFKAKTAQHSQAEDMKQYGLILHELISDVSASDTGT